MHVKQQLYGLVRDAQGRPKVDDPKNLPVQIRAVLTPQDKAYLGLGKE